ncbi:MAG: hypothetical protein WD043_06845 [Gemmatimonadales bacterium]
MPEDNPFAQLPRDADPPPALKTRVMADLRRRGLIRSVWLPRVLALAAGLALFAAGTWVGARDAGPPAGQQFALLLYEPASFDTTRPHDELAAEYGAWAQSLGTRFVAGDALGDQRVLGGTVGSEVPTGYFIVRASSWEEAMSIAAACPHLRHGGTVAVQAIMT